MAVVTDSVADLLTRIRNASRAGHDQVEIPRSRLKLEVVKILTQEKFIRGYQSLQDDRQGVIRVFLKYSEEREPVIHQIKRISRPGIRVYAGADDLKKVLSGMGIAIVSTSQGVITDRECRRRNIGGEVLCQVW